LLDLPNPASSTPAQKSSAVCAGRQPAPLATVLNTCTGSLRTATKLLGIAMTPVGTAKRPVGTAAMLRRTYAFPVETAVAMLRTDFVCFVSLLGAAPGHAASAAAADGDDDDVVETAAAAAVAAAVPAAPAVAQATLQQTDDLQLVQYGNQFAHWLTGSYPATGEELVVHGQHLHLLALALHPQLVNCASTAAAASPACQGPAAMTSAPDLVWAQRLKQWALGHQQERSAHWMMGKGDV